LIFLWSDQRSKFCQFWDPGNLKFWAQGPQGHFGDWRP